MRPIERNLPLARYERVHSRDVDQARATVEEAFCSHRLVPAAGNLEVRFHAVQVGGVGLHYLDYGSDVRIQPDNLTDCYLVQIPLHGTAEVRSSSAEVVSSPTVASILGPDNQYDMLWRAGNRQLIVKLDRTAVEQHLHKSLGVPLGSQLRFQLDMDLTAPLIRSWRSVVNLLSTEVENDGTIPAEPLAMREMERLLLTQLFLAQPNNYSGALHSPPARLVPRVIQRAADLIEAHAAEPLTVEDIAVAVNVSVRALQDGFRSAFDTTPTNYLREVRLRKAHADLMAADPSAITVTDVAVRWGFLHLGRFSVMYRARFGESPSQTLRH